MDGHKKWKQRETELLKEAIKIYKNSSDFNPNLNLNTMGDKIYDLMNEEDWEKFVVIREKIKAQFEESD